MDANCRGASGTGVCVVALMALGLAPLGCGSEPAEDGQAAPDEGGQRPDAGRADPCPDGWDERFDEGAGIMACEPWLRSSPVR